MYEIDYISEISAIRNNQTFDTIYEMQENLGSVIRRVPAMLLLQRTKLMRRTLQLPRLISALLR